MNSHVPLALMLVWCLCGGVGPECARAVDVTQHHNHGSRDGLYVDPDFTRGAVAGLARDLAFNGRIVGNVYAQPLYIERGPGNKAMVIAVTESNYVYALDALTGGVLWSTNVGPPVPAGVLPCGNVQPVGISGTPVVDLPTRALFLDAMISSAGKPKHYVFSLNVDSGNLNAGWPVDVEATALSGTNHFKSPAQGQRGALAIVGTNLYVPYGGLFGDCDPYYGWVVGVPLNDPTRVTAWATTARRGGAWAVGGIASDGADAFVATGNTIGASVWGGGEAVIRFPSDLVLTNGTANYWAPTNWVALDNADLDVGGSGPVVFDVPGATPSKLVAAFGKDGNVYLLNRTNLGGVSVPLAQAHVSPSSIIQAAAAYQTTRGSYLVFAASGNLYALRVAATSPPTITVAWTASEGGGRGSPFVTSTDGTNNVVVWGIGSDSGGDHRLHGFDGDTGTNIFTGGGPNELMSGTRRFNTAIAARGRVYVANDNQVYAFRLPSGPVKPIVLTDLAILPNSTFQFAFANVSGTNFSVYSTTNLATPFTNWLKLGSVSETAPEYYQFVDLQPTSPNVSRFYRVQSP